MQPARNVVGLAPPVPARGSVRAFPPPGPPAVKAELMEGFTRACFEGDPAVKAEWGSVARWTMAMPRRVREQLPHVHGDFKAIGLVEGYPVLREDLGRRGGSDDRAGHQRVPRL